MTVRLVAALKPRLHSTRLLLTYGQNSVLKAVLPAPSQVHPRAAATLLEGLSLWYQRSLSVVLYADGQDCSSGLGLCDGFGIGNWTVHYEVEVFDRSLRRRGLGPFGDLRRLALRGAL
jgi:hypothetical protein